MGANANRKKVLVVDDEPQVLAAIEDTLEDDYEVLVQTSAQVALKVVEKEPDLSVILSDQRMPGMTGDQFLAQARTISDASRVMITGYADLQAVISAVNQGNIFGYISKPWDPEALKIAIFKAAEHNRLLRELSEEQRLLHNLMDNAPDAIFFKDRAHRFLRLNRAHAAILGVTRAADAVGKTAVDFFPPLVSRQHHEDDTRIFASGKPVLDRVRRTDAPGGRVLWRSTTKAPVADEKGKVVGLVGITRDITERQEAAEKLRRLNRVHAMLSGISTMIVRVQDRGELYREACRIAVEAGNFRFAWAGAVDRTAMEVYPVAWHGVERGFLEAARGRLSLRDAGSGLGLVPRAVLAKQPMVSNDLMNDPQIQLKEEHAKHGANATAVLPLALAGEVIAVLVLNAVERNFFDDDEMRLLGDLAAEISFALAHLEKSERLDHLAYYDVLTGLANRTLFLERVSQLISSAAKSEGRLAVAVGNVERFRAVNDSLGRQAGDQVLRELAGRLRSSAAEPNRVARLGADHFAFVVPEARQASEVARALTELARSCFGEPFRIGEDELRMSMKAGIALYPDDGSDAETLLKNAEAALKKAQQRGEEFLFYEQDMNARVTERLTLENRLRQAVEREEFVLHYQPKVTLEGRRIVGLEALIRWQTPEGKLVPPAHFIPLLEETGLIIPVGAWAMRKAVLDHAELLRQGFAAPRVAVNVSAIQLRRRNFVDTVKHAIGHGASPAGIDLEITESLVMEDVDANIQKLNAVHDLGLQVAIDDFGTGHSSLAYLAKLPVHLLKIDRSFIITMLEEPNAMTLVSTIISLARSLKLKVIAEGVDSEEQAKVLTLLRCDEMQGYLFSKPVPIAALVDMLSKTS